MESLVEIEPCLVGAASNVWSFRGLHSWKYQLSSIGIWFCNNGRETIELKTTEIAQNRYLYSFSYGTQNVSGLKTFSEAKAKIKAILYSVPPT